MSTTIKVAGMTCAHCVSAVTEELSALPGVTAVTVDPPTGAVTPVTITSAAELAGSAIEEAIHEAGYALAPDR
jgi:copper chaperone